MRERFRHFYRPSSDEFDELWRRALIVLDANALLNVYRYSASTADSFLSVLEAASAQLWLPHQCGEEFQRNRLQVVSEHQNGYNKVNEAIEGLEKQFTSVLQDLKKHEALSVGSLEGKLQTTLVELKSELEMFRSRDPLAQDFDPFEDPLWSRVTEIYTGRVGEAFDPETYADLVVDGRARYAAQTPPGYKDVGKPEPDRYGDLAIWRQMLSHAKHEQRPMIFVTDDSKEDWWRRESGKTLGPRVELVAEFFETTGQVVYFYSPDGFLRFAKQHLSASITDDSLDEVRAFAEVKANESIRLEKVRGRLRGLRELREQTARELRSGEKVSTLGHADSDTARKLDELDRRIAEMDHERASIVELIGELPGTESGSSEVHSRFESMLAELESRALVARRQRDQLLGDFAAPRFWPGPSASHPELVRRLKMINDSIREAEAALGQDPMQDDD